MWGYTPFRRRLNMLIFGGILLGLTSLVSGCGTENSVKNRDFRGPDSAASADSDSGYKPSKDSGFDDSFDLGYRDVGDKFDQGRGDVSPYNDSSSDSGDKSDLTASRDLGENDSGKEFDNGEQSDSGSRPDASQELRAIACPDIAEVVGGPYRINDVADPHNGWCKYTVNLNDFFRFDGCRSTGYINRYLFDFGIITTGSLQCYNEGTRFGQMGLFEGKLGVRDGNNNTSFDNVLFNVN